MFDHVTIGTADRRASERFYRTVLSALGHEPTAVGANFVEWNDFSIAQAGPNRRVTTGLHIAFVAPSLERMEAFWRAGIGAGHRDDGAPGPRPEYGPDYHGAFLLDPDGNSAEATFHGNLRGDGGGIDHLWIRVSDRAKSRRFYATVGGHAGFREVEHLPDRTRYAREGHGSLSIVDGRPTTPFHMAFGVADTAAVESFHAAATQAGFTDNGLPGERPQYHPGYFGAFVFDPDGHNVEAVFHDR